MEVKETLTKYVLELTNQEKVDASLNLFESNLISSLDVLDLISFVEETFNISMEDDDISMENFGSINDMVSLVGKLK
ncbi:MAG: hypothetical protein BMS9Abin03_407 [Thermodesulfobacteriota bacterium]|nr:MAG: hypothetical protein BMS9Abin03_407 [Thermodesulfobacteriota bacterium]